MQGNLFAAPAGKGSLELTLAIQRICRRATAEGKTQVRPATLRKLERYIGRLRKAVVA